MTNHRKESTLHSQIDYPPYIPLGIIKTLLTESLDGIPCELALSETSAVDEGAILLYHTVVAEFTEFVFFLVEHAILAVGLDVEGGVGL